MDWIKTIGASDLLTSLIVITAATGFGAVGYLYRSQRERKANFNAALHLLLEIWHHAGLLTKPDVSADFKRLTRELEKAFPGTDLPSEAIEPFQAHIESTLQDSLQKKAFDKFDTLQEAYATVVHLIAKSDPIYAYHLETSGNIKTILNLMDDYMTQALIPLGDGEEAQRFKRCLQREVSEYVQKDLMDSLEKSLKGLALRTNFATTYPRTLLTIRRRRQRLKASTSVETDTLALNAAAKCEKMLMGREEAQAPEHKVEH